MIACSPYASFAFYAVNDLNIQSNQVTVTLSVISTTPPTASYNGPTTTNENTPLSITGITAQDVDPSQTVTVIVSQLPTEGSLSQFDGTPITSPNTAITDSAYRLIFTPASNTFGQYLVS